MRLMSQAVLALGVSGRVRLLPTGVGVVAGRSQKTCLLRDKKALPRHTVGVGVTRHNFWHTLYSKTRNTAAGSNIPIFSFEPELDHLLNGNIPITATKLISKQPTRV